MSKWQKIKARVWGSNRTNHSVFKHMLTLAFGTASAKIIGLLAIPVLTRLYSPDDFGVLGVFTAFVGILAPVMSLRYVMGIPVPRSDRLAFNLFALSLLIILLSNVMFFAVIGFVHEPLFAFFSLQALDSFWWLIPLAILLLSVYEWMMLWATRQKAFKVLARTKVTQAFLGAATKIALGLAGLKPLGLLIGQSVQQGSGSFTIWRSFNGQFKGLLASLSWSRMRWLLLWYRELPYFRLPSQFILVFSTQAPLLYTAAVFSSEVTGQLALALMALSLPMQLLGKTMGSAYFAEVAAIGRNHPIKLRAVTFDVVRKLLVLGFFPCLVLFVLGPLLFQTVFGSEWALAGQFAQLLAVYLLVQFVTSPMSNLLTVLDKQKVFLQINLLRLVLIVLALGGAYWAELSALHTVLIYALTMALHYVATGLIIISCIPKGHVTNE